MHAFVHNGAVEVGNASPVAAQALWTAGAVARMLHIPPSTLRGWHGRYAIPVTGSHSGPHRRYNAADVAALSRMQRLIESGVSTSSAAALVFRAAVVANAPAESEVDVVVAAARALDVHAVLARVEAHIAAHGVISAWQHLCCPALDAFGGTHAPDPDTCIDVVKMLSWAIAAALNRVPDVPASPGSAPAIVLGCAPGEGHSLPMDALRAALAQVAVPAHPLGPDVPIVALRGALHRTSAPPPAAVVWALTPVVRPRPIVRELHREGTTIVLAGPGWAAAPLRGEFVQVNDLRGAVDVVARLWAG